MVGLIFEFNLECCAIMNLCFCYFVLTVKLCDLSSVTDSIMKFEVFVFFFGKFSSVVLEEITFDFISFTLISIL